MRAAFLHRMMHTVIENHEQSAEAFMGRERAITLLSELKRLYESLSPDMRTQVTGLLSKAASMQLAVECREGDHAAN